MAQGIIYMVDGQGLKRMTPSAPENEDRMQELVARYPELITDGDGDLLLIKREHPIGDGEAESRWSVDHLFVTREGVPVLVELKRAVDTRLRREVVGQMLDYAANATAYWQAGVIAGAFEKTAANAGLNPETCLAEFLGERDSTSFWEQVDSNFRAGRIKLVFVADAIPRELARIVEFMNDQMLADVRAVELRWFTGEGNVTTLSPRIIGETERAAASKAGAKALEPTSREQWLADHIAPFGPDALAGANGLIRIVEEEGGAMEVASTQGSIVAIFRGDDGKPFYPLYLSRSGAGISLALGYLKPRGAYASDEARLQLYDRLVGIAGPLSTANIAGYPSFKARQMADPAIERGVRDLLRDVVSNARAN